VYPDPTVPAKILVVDDDDDIRRIAALSLRRIGGFHVVLAAHGAEAVEMALADVPDLVLLDVTMPEMDGPATLLALRAQAATSRVPVVFFTATSSEAEVARLVGLGAAGVVPKPFEVQELPRRVRQILQDLGYNDAG
jgi:two-component system OmpR family response regulator